MSSCCATCNHRNHALAADSHTAKTQVDVCLITLHFKKEVVVLNTTAYVSLNTMLNNITDAAESTWNPSNFTVWSPCISDPSIVVILTTAGQAFENKRSPMFKPVLQHLLSPPSVHHVFLDQSIRSLVAWSSEQTIASEVMIVHAPNPSVAGAIGRQFGWNPQRSALSAQVGVKAPGGTFSRPGDLIRDFWAWAELSSEDPASPSSSSAGSAHENSGKPRLISTNSEEKNMSLFWAEDDERRNTEDETLVMIFQWSSHADAYRFKHPLQKSFGQNSNPVSSHMWERHVAHPVRQLQGIGAKVDTYKLDLRSVEPRIDTGRSMVQDRSAVGARRLSTRPSGFGEKISGFWSR